MAGEKIIVEVSLPATLYQQNKKIKIQTIFFTFYCFYDIKYIL